MKLDSNYFPYKSERVPSIKQPTSDPSRIIIVILPFFRQQYFQFSDNSIFSVLLLLQTQSINTISQNPNNSQTNSSISNITNSQTVNNSIITNSTEEPRRKRQEASRPNHILLLTIINPIYPISTVSLFFYFCICFYDDDQQFSNIVINVKVFIFMLLMLTSARAERECLH